MSLNYANDRGLRTVKNSSGSNVDQYGILKLNGLDITPTNNASFFANKQVFNTTTPTADADFCIAQRAIPNGRYGPALFSGVSACKVQVSNESHQFAKAGTSLARLDSAESGPAKILWKESGTGEKNAVVLLAFGSSGNSDLDINCTFEVEIGSPDGVRPSQPTPTVRNFKTQDSAKFYFDGVTPFATVPCVIHYTGTYSFWPIRQWTRAVTTISGSPVFTGLYHWNGMQGLTGLSGRHSVRRMVQGSTRAAANRFFISLPTLVSTQDPNTTGIRQPYHIPVGFTFIADNLTGGATRLVPDLTDEWPWPGLTFPDLEQLHLQVVAIEYNNTRVSG